MSPIKVKSSAFLITLPPGWTSEVLDRGETRITTPAPMLYNATLDWQARVVRLGIGTFGKPINKKEYKGRNWHQQMVADAIACLRKLEATSPMKR